MSDSSAMQSHAMQSHAMQSHDAGAELRLRENVDLHAHTTASDGAVSPGELVTTAVRAGLTAIAITDHDTIAGVDEAVRAGALSEIRVVAGCELSAYDVDFEIHLLALHVSDVNAIAPRLASFQEDRIQRAEAIVDRLGRVGAPISIDDVMTEAAGGALGRPHVARVLIRAGHAVDFRQAFDRFLGAGRPAYVAKPRFSIADAIALAHAAGALAIWAHPGREGTRERLVRLLAQGLDGVEVLHPGHAPADVERLQRFVNEYELVPSGGSDWHGAMEGYRVLGNMHVPDSWLELQDARLTLRAA